MLRRAALRKVESGSLSDKVYSALRLSILGDDFPPGSPLHIEKLAKELGVSTTPVREALARLSSDGLVDLKRNKKPVVTTINLDEIHQLYAIRRLLEPYFARRLMPKVEKDASLRKLLLELRKDIEGVLECLNTTSPLPHFYGKYMKVDHRFQKILSQAEEGGVAGKLTDLVNNYVFRLRLFSKGASFAQKTERMRMVCREHIRILDALLDDDPQAVEESIIEHLTLAEKRSLRVVKEASDFGKSWQRGGEKQDQAKSSW